MYKLSLLNFKKTFLIISSFVFVIIIFVKTSGFWIVRIKQFNLNFSFCIQKKYIQILKKNNFKHHPYNYNY